MIVSTRADVRFNGIPLTRSLISIDTERTPDIASFREALYDKFRDVDRGYYANVLIYMGAFFECQDSDLVQILANQDISVNFYSGSRTSPK